MKKKWMRWIAGMACVCGLGIALCAASAEKNEAAPSPDTRAARDKELQTMSKVIEESLNRSGLGDWYGTPEAFTPSPFEGKIRFDYIPTVGAIFTIPVNFTVTERIEVKKEETKNGSNSGEPDLWEKNANPLAPGHASPHDVIVGATSGMGGVGMIGMGMDPFVTVQPKYDAKKVETLRKTLIETIGRYGSRLTTVAPEERILLVIEAPSGGANVLHTIGMPGMPPTPPVPPAPSVPAMPAAHATPPAPPAAPPAPPAPGAPGLVIRHSEHVSHSTGSTDSKSEDATQEAMEKALEKATAEVEKAGEATPQQALAIVQQALSLAQHEIAKDAASSATSGTADAVEEAMGKAIAQSAVGMVQGAIGMAQQGVAAASGFGAYAGPYGNSYVMSLMDGSHTGDRYLLSFKKSDVSEGTRTFDQMAPKVEERRY